MRNTTLVQRLYTKASERCTIKAAIVQGGCDESSVAAAVRQVMQVIHTTHTTPGNDLDLRGSFT